MKNFILVTAWLFSCLVVKAQNVVQAEYAIDIDSGVGKNKFITLANPQSDGSYNLNINLSGVAPGYHKLYIRTKDSDGKWSFTSRRNIEVISPNSVKKITGGEYFFDIDPGFNAATPITITLQDSIILQNFTAAVGSLSVGYHKLYIRTKDSNNNWSQTSRRNVEVINSVTAFITGAEYFFSTDAGVGNANPVSFGVPLQDGSFSFKIPLDKIPTGSNTLYIRARDSVNNSWSITQWQKDSVITSSGLDSIWSRPATWSNNKVPDANTVVLLHHKVYVDTNTATCKSLVSYRNDAQCIVLPNMKITITGKR
jgi:hypothetical protein